MSKAKLQEARELIRAGRHNEARDILQKIDHPIAKEWLQKLDKAVPDSRRTNVYADSAEDLNHPYEPPVNGNSTWVQSISSAQSQLDSQHKDKVKRGKEYRAKQRRKRWLIGGTMLLAAAIFIALIAQPMIEFVQRDLRPIIYLFAFPVFLGIPLRILARLGRETDGRPGIPAAIMVAIVVGIVVLFIEYGFYLRELEVYDLTLDGNYVASFLRRLNILIGLEEFMLYVIGLVVVYPTVFATDTEFSEAIEAGLRGGRQRW